MSCKCATFDESTGRYRCSVTDGDCEFLIPSSKACAEVFGEGPDAVSDYDEEEIEC